MIASLHQEIICEDGEITSSHTERNLSKVGSLETLTLKYTESSPFHLKKLTALPDQDEKEPTEWASVDH